MRVEKLNRGDAMFYQRLGPIFGSREIGKEVGISVYDDEDKVFYAAFEGDVMLGIASVRKGLVSDCWTAPQHRFKGALTAILSTILKDSGALRATCTPASVNVFLRAGFVKVGSIGKFTKVKHA